MSRSSKTPRSVNLKTRPGWRNTTSKETTLVSAELKTFCLPAVPVRCFSPVFKWPHPLFEGLVRHRQVRIHVAENGTDHALRQGKSVRPIQHIEPIRSPNGLDAQAEQTPSSFDGGKRKPPGSVVMRPKELVFGASRGRPLQLIHAQSGLANPTSCPFDVIRRLFVSS